MKSRHLPFALLGAILCLVPSVSELWADDGVVPAAAEPALTATEPESVDVRISDERREALLLLQQAELELEKGAGWKALELAVKAQSLYPESRSITALLRQLRAERQTRTEVSSRLRAKARLAAALARAGQLLGQRRYAEAANLLDGVHDATDLFPDDTRVTLFREQAARYADSARYALEVRSLGARNGPSGASRTQASSQFSRPSPVAPPRNLARLKPAVGRAPTWYRQMKASLAVPMNVEYAGLPLGYVLEQITKTTGVEFIIDEAVRKAGVPIETLIDLRINGASAETVLALVTEISATEYVLLEDRVVITTRDKALDYVAVLPRVLADRWIRLHVLFPEQYDEELARPTGVSQQALETEAVEIPPYLRSGESLLAEVERLLR